MTTAIANSPEAWSARADKPPLEAVGWTATGQTERFTAVLAALDPQPGETLLDYGCGTGDLSDWVDDDINYIGYDWAPGMIARAAVDHPDRRFHHVRPRHDVDLTAIVGTFNLADSWSKDRTFAEIRAIWDETTRALASCLYYGTDERCIRYEPAELAAFASREARLFTVDRHRDNDLLLVLRR